VIVFVTGGTGSVGSQVVKNLLMHGHRVVGLARSQRSADKLAQAGASVVIGNLAKPDTWIAQIEGVDALIHMGLEFSPEDGEIDRGFLSALIESRSGQKPLRIILTGGCWIYGNTGDYKAQEGEGFDESDAWNWWSESLALANTSSELETIVIHPAMVWNKDGNCFGMLDNIRSRGPVKIHENADHRWTLVNDEDLAELYRLVLEQGMPGEEYNAAGQEGVCMGDLARQLCKKHNHHAWLDVVAVADTMREQGAWAEGYGLDQQMSSAKARRELGWEPKYCDILGSF
jgi:nucleoside-diphosphate-sugar epimerase